MRLCEELTGPQSRQAAQHVETVDDIARLLDCILPVTATSRQTAGDLAAAAGLREVSVGTTGISEVSDGSEPTYRGYRLADLVRHATFDDVVGILLDGRLPARPVRPTAGLLGAPPAGTGSSATAYLTLLLGLLPDRPYSAADACGALRDLAAALARHDAGAVRGDAGLAEQILAACLPARRQDRIEDPYAVRAFEQDLIIHAEHGLCASALVARVAASTGAAAGSCLAAAAHTFAGPRHGGALPAVAAMARRLRSPAEAAAHLRERVSRTGSAPGFGHAVYRREDPRCEVYRDVLAAGGYRVEGDDEPGSVALVVNAGRRLADVGLYPNVDLYTALLYQRLGLREDAYLPAFMLARTVGWLAHVAEASTSPLIRPQLTYCGHRRTLVRPPANLADVPDGNDPGPTTDDPDGRRSG